MAKTEKSKPTHLQDFAAELVARHGPRTAGMVWHAFTNLGNVVPGDSVAEQIAAVEAEMSADPRIAHQGDNPGRGGAWFGPKEQGNASGK